MDPGEVLGVGQDAGEEEIRAAYVRKVKEHPPDRSPEEFERIRDAYDSLRDPRRRMREKLLSVDPLRSGWTARWPTRSRRAGSRRISWRR